MKFLCKTIVSTFLKNKEYLDCKITVSKKRKSSKPQHQVPPTALPRLPEKDHREEGAARVQAEVTLQKVRLTQPENAPSDSKEQFQGWHRIKGQA